MRINICDDEELYREHIALYCREEFRPEQPDINCFASGEELLKYPGDADYLFLDIEMGGMDGIFVKDLFEKLGKRTRIIFLTSHTERMVEAFGLNVIGFLEKPIHQEAFSDVVQKMRRMYHRDVVEWSEGGRNYCFSASEVRYIEAQDKYTVLHTYTSQYLVRRTVNEWEQLLPSTLFCRVNRSYIIHFDLFERTKNEIVLDQKKVIKLSRKNKAAVFEQYKKFLRNKAEELG